MAAMGGEKGKVARKSGGKMMVRNASAPQPLATIVSDTFIPHHFSATFPHHLSLLAAQRRHRARAK